MVVYRLNSFTVNYGYLWGKGKHMRKKKILKFMSAVLVGVMLLSLAGCGDEKDSDSSVEDIDYSVGLNADGTLKDIDPADYVELADYKAKEIPQAVLQSQMKRFSRTSTAFLSRISRYGSGEGPRGEGR